MNKIIIFSFAFALNLTAFAQTDLGPIEKNHCEFFESEGLKTILVPLDHSGELSARQLTYGYQLIENTAKESKPKTLIYLTGGPGAGMIGNYGIVLFDKILSLGFNLILIDPRGVACNGLDQGEVPDGVISTEQTALDIIEVIKSEKLTNYIIMGQSYGTMLGTVLTSKINERSELAQPELLILEGTFGRSLSSGLEYLENMVQVFKEEMPKHFPKVKEVFFSGQEKELPFGLPLTYWINTLMTYPTSGSKSFLEVYPEVVDFLEGYPETLNDKDLELYFKSDFEDYSTFSGSEDILLEEDVQETIEMDYVYYSIMCKEMSPQDPNLGEFAMEGGELLVRINKNADVCKAFEFSKQPYDASNYPLKTKTLYFQGISDGQTPLYYLEHHYDANTAPEKTVVKVSGGGHGVFYTDLEACATQIWSQIKKGNTDFDDVLDQEGHCLKAD